MAQQKEETTLVTISKKNGNLINPFDVYIGPEIRNEHWNLEKSAWSNPYHFEKSSLVKYRSWILKTMRDQINDQLGGKVLGCFCKDHRKCHGSVLVELANAHLPVKKEVHGEGIIFFKGDDCPLSNFYPCWLTRDGRIFNCATQMYAYDHLVFMGKNNLALNVLQARNGYDAYEMLKNTFPYTSKTFNMRQQLTCMKKIIQIKYNQCEEFRRYLDENCNSVYVEATKSPFWGAGIDITMMNEKSTLSDVRGYNILGWIIKLVYMRNSPVPGEDHKRITIPPPPPDGATEEVLKGVELVNKHLTTA